MNSKIGCKMSDLRKISSDDVQIIHDLALQIWPHTFKDILSSEQIDYMLNKMYDSTVLERQISEGHEFYIWLEKGLAIAFIGLEQNYPVKDSLRIHKIYILPKYQGLGIGKNLIAEAKKIALTSELSSINLNVNRFNNAVDFYKYLGFEITKTEDIDIGNGYLMEDYVMEMMIG